jgi:cytochrome c oxidase subunit 4
MSSIAHAAPDGAHHVDNKFGLFIQVAMILAVITGIEIVIVYLPIAEGLIVAGLVVLSIVKFMYVIFVFMHLKWDKLFCTILFFIGLVLAVGTVWALILLFSAGDSEPVGMVAQAARSLLAA